MQITSPGVWEQWSGRNKFWVWPPVGRSPPGALPSSGVLNLLCSDGSFDRIGKRNIPGRLADDFFRQPC